MSDLKLFSIRSGDAKELASSTHRLEKTLHEVFEKNLHTLLGVHFLAHEYSTGPAHGGRIDTLGLDENNSPVIIEYKRSVSENVINQGLFYLDWLLDHKAAFKLLVLEARGQEEADRIDWSAPRLICVASEFKKYDEHAIRQINRNIDLIRYKLFGDDFMALELSGSVSSTSTHSKSASGSGQASSISDRASDKPMVEALEEISDELKLVYKGLCDFTLSLGDDVNQKQLKLYSAFRRIKNFATVTPQKKNFRLYLHLDPRTVELSEGWTRDVSEIGHWGTGDLEVWIACEEDLERAKPLIKRAYEER